MNVYDHPEKFGLQMIGMVDKSDGNYQYDMFVVWKNGRRLCYGTDEGCSCPTNFEGQGVNDLTLAPKADVIKALKEWAAEDATREREALDAAVVELCLKIRAA
jgi:hypothetical protein